MFYVNLSIILTILWSKIFSGFASYNESLKTSKYDDNEYWYISEIADNFYMQKNNTAPRIATSK